MSRSRLPNALLLAASLSTPWTAFTAHAKDSAAAPPRNGVVQLKNTQSEETDWEKSLSKPDMNKSFNPFAARLGFRSAPAGVRPAQSAAFAASKTFSGTKPASADKTFSNSSFYTPQFPTRPAPTRTFPSSSFAGSTSAKEAEPKAQTAAPMRLPGTVQSPDHPVPATSSALTKEYAGPEAERKKMRFTPANGPVGGVTYGRVLSVEEVREILNKSK